jgi:hypothetical protein
VSPAADVAVVAVGEVHPGDDRLCALDVEAGCRLHEATTGCERDGLGPRIIARQAVLRSQLVNLCVLVEERADGRLRLGGRRGDVVVDLVGHGDGVNCDLVAEGSGVSHGTGCVFAGVVPAVVVRSWVLVVGAGAEQVPDGGEDCPFDRDDGSEVFRGGRRCVGI